jgi:hypothetical protein
MCPSCLLSGHPAEMQQVVFCIISVQSNDPIFRLVLRDDSPVEIASLKSTNDASFCYVIRGVPQTFENGNPFSFNQNTTKVSTRFIKSFISPDSSEFYLRCVVE